MLEGLRAGERLPKDAFEEVRRRAVREAFKWNITDGGNERLCGFPLLVERSVVQKLAEYAVALGQEAERAEAELVTRPGLQLALGVPWRLQRALSRWRATPGLRYCRFDFHPTLEGDVAITEGNFDVAAGWNETSAVTALFAEHVEKGEPAGDPAELLAARLAQRLGSGATVGMLHLTQYTDDHQVARFLASQFERHGLEIVFFNPTQLRKAGRRAGALVSAKLRPLDAVFRFFPAEWSCRLEHFHEWVEAAASPDTVWVNPLTAVLCESKRFPLAWPDLRVSLPTWTRLLPETRGPLFARGQEWVLKPAFGHEGYQVTLPGTTSRDRARAHWRRARLSPWRWVAQRPFRAASILTPDGPRFPCVGIYVIDGAPCGLYGRLAASPLIDDGAQDVVVLIRR